MRGGKGSVSGAESYEAIGAYWDRHDLAEHAAQAPPAEFEVDIRSQSTLFAVEAALSERLRESASRRGVSAETLLNLWLQERVPQEAPAP